MKQLILIFLVAPALIATVYGQATCKISPTGRIAVGENCLVETCSKRFLDFGMKDQGDIVEATCVFENAAVSDLRLGLGTEEWKCVDGDWELQGESILCDAKDCLDADPRCQVPPWSVESPVGCEIITDTLLRLASCNAKKVNQWKQSGCQGPPPCSYSDHIGVLPREDATTIPDDTLTSESPLNITSSSVSSFNVTSWSAQSQDSTKYGALYFWPLAVLVFLPPVYWLVLRTKQFSPCKRTVNIGMQLMIVGWIVYVFITRNHLIHESIHSIRGDVGRLGLAYLLLGYSILQLIRYCLPPLYFVFPLDTLFIFVILLSTSLYEAVLYWQLITCSVSILGFFLLRFLYSDWAQRAFENEDIEYFKDIRDLLKVFDDHWRTRFAEASMSMRVIYISSFFNAEFFSGYIGLFWMAVRGEITNFSFIGSCILGFIMELPASVIQFRLICNALDSMEHSRFEIFKEFEWYEVVPYVMLTGFATCVIQWNNLCAIANAIISCCCPSLVLKRESMTLSTMEASCSKDSSNMV